MPHQDPTPVDRDADLQCVLIDLLVRHHPGGLTQLEICRQLEPRDAEAFATVDGLDRAARDLVSYGLAHYNDQFVTASLAAVHAADLFRRT